MNNKSPLIEKYHISNFPDLLSVCIGKALANQSAFYSDVLEDAKITLDIKEAILNVNDDKYPVSYIGTEDKNAKTFIWADACPEFIDSQVQDIVEIMEMGEIYNIKELIDAKVKLTEEIDGQSLSMVASILFDENMCYYKHTEEDKTLFMFVKNVKEEVFKPVSIQKFGNIVKKCVQNYDLNQELFIESFLIMNRCGIIKKENSIVGSFDNNLRCEVIFDDARRIVKLKFEAVRP